MPDPPETSARASPWHTGRVRWWGLLWVGTGVGVAVSLAGFLARAGLPFEQMCHFRAQYFLFLGACTLLFLAGRRFKSAAVAGTVAAVNLALIVPLYVSGSSPPGGGPTVRILLANVHTANTNHEGVLEYVRASNPDVVVLEEVNYRWLQALAPLDASHPYAVKEQRSDNFGIALWSHRPFEESSTRFFGEAGLPSISVRLRVGSQPLSIVATHPLPPTSEESVGLRNEQLSELARYVTSLSGARVVIGDLNTTSWSPCFERLENGTGLRDSRRGFGVQPTWPAGLPWLSIPIDHCLVSSDVAVLSREVGPAIGSDHYPLLVELSLPRGR